jgi:hypothetical protein
VQPFGSSHYDFNSDQIVYEPWSKWSSGLPQ